MITMLLNMKPMLKSIRYIDDFIAQGKEKGADLVIFSNPNNPTGHCLKKEEILKIVDGFDCPVLIDEAYMEFSDQSVLPYVEEHENLLVTRTLSKAFGLAGLRVGFLVSIGLGKFLMR